MTSIEDPLTKPVWPSVDDKLQETVLSLLITPCSRGTSEYIKVGFNQTMEAIEAHLNGGNKVDAVFVSRSDLHPAECLPIALASSAGQIRLMTLPKGSKSKLNGEGIISICSGSDETQILSLVEPIGPAKLDWVYQGATAVKRKGKPKSSK